MNSQSSEEEEARPRVSFEDARRKYAAGEFDLQDLDDAIWETLAEIDIDAPGEYDAKLPPAIAHWCAAREMEWSIAMDGIDWPCIYRKEWLPRAAEASVALGKQASANFLAELYAISQLPEGEWEARLAPLDERIEEFYTYEERYAWMFTHWDDFLAAEKIALAHMDNRASPACQG